MKLDRIIVVFCLMLSSACQKKESKLTLELAKLKQTYLYTHRVLLDENLKSHTDFYNHVSLFYNVPAQYRLDSCRASWDRAYCSFLNLGAFRNSMLSSPLSYEKDKALFDLFPVNPSYIDETASNPTSNIIYDQASYPNLSTESIISYNQVGGVQNITCGFHALEFMFWGEDLYPNSPGVRQNTVFLSTSTTNDRRRLLVKSSSVVLYNNMKSLAYSASYEDYLKKINGRNFVVIFINDLSQLITNDIIPTIQKPLQNSNPHLEISNFSDKSFNHIKAKLKGLRYALNSSELIGETVSSAYYLEDLIKQIDSERMNRIQKHLDEIDANLNSYATDFENAISVDQAKLYQLIDKLNALSSELIEFAANFED